MNIVKGIQLRNIAVYTPDEVRDNEYYANYYQEQGTFARYIAEHNLGRDKRNVIKPGTKETTLTMALESCRRVLKEENLTGENIDIICFCSLTPEYLSPPMAMLLHHELGGKRQAFCYDINANCAGMLWGFEQLSKYMSSVPDVKRALIVGTECLSMVFAPDDIINNVCYGDSSCAVILERVDDESKFIDTDYYVDSSLYHYVKSPKCGLSNVGHVPKSEMYYTFKPMTITFDISINKINDMLFAHGLKISDIKLFCTSQYTKKVGESIYEGLGVKEEQQIYIGDQYGYTGANSPFICLYEAIKAERVERGDYLLMWTVGASLQYIMTLIRY